MRRSTRINCFATRCRHLPIRRRTAACYFLYIRFRIVVPGRANLGFRLPITNRMGAHLRSENRLIVLRG